MVQIDRSIYNWLVQLHILTPSGRSTQQRIAIAEDTSKALLSGVKKRNQKGPESLGSLKQHPQSAGVLYNWNLLNEVMKTVGFEIDSETKTAIVSGEWEALEVVLGELKTIYDSAEEQLSESHQASPVLKDTPAKKTAKKPQRHSEDIDILDYVIGTLSTKLKLTKKQAVALIADNNRYLAHVFVKGVKGLYHEIEEILQTFSHDVSMIVSKIAQAHDVGEFFLQMVKPSILSKSEEVVSWGCQVLVQLAEELASADLLPLGYQWLIKENGGLSTAILALARHPKLAQTIVNVILQFGKFNISELLTVELRKFCPDSLGYLKFVLQIFAPVVESKISSQELLSSGALDYWIQQAEKGADGGATETRIVSIELLCRIWKAYPLHVEQTLGLANNIMNYFKRGMRQTSEILRLNLLQQLFELLVHFARLKNPFASVIYKKLTFMFIENHQLPGFRQVMLLNFQTVFSSFLSIPVDIFLQPFAKQLKISEGKTYILNVSDMEFIRRAAQHKKLKPTTAVELVDFLAKTYLNSPVFWQLSYQSLQILCERFIDDEVFLDYCVKLVKVCLALFLSSMKLRKTKDDQTRLAMQKRSQIVALLLMFGQLQNETLNHEIKILTAHTKLEVKEQYKCDHAGLIKVLEMFGDLDDIENEALAVAKSVSSVSGLEDSRTSQPLKLPKINQKRNQEQEELMSDVSHSRKSNISSESNKRQDFPRGKDYSEFETEQQRAFLQQNGLGFKVKKNKQSQLVANTNNYQRMQKQFNIREAVKDYSAARERRDVSSTLKAKQQIDRIKERKAEEQVRKAKEQELIVKKKEALIEKIKKEMEHRTVAVGKISDKNVEARVFNENQINQRLLANHEMVICDPQQEEDRDSQSMAIVFKKYQWFLKKVFLRYENASELKRKEVFDTNGQLLHFISQVDCMRMLKQKGIEKDKTLIQEILKLVVSKKELVNGVNYDQFAKMLEQYAIKTYSGSHKQPLGEYLKDIFRKLGQGENFRMQEEEDETAKELTEKLKHDSELEIPTGYKKVVEREYQMSALVTHMNAKILPQAYIYCYQILNEMIEKGLKIREMESGFAVRDEMKVVRVKLPPQPPRLLRRNEEVSKIDGEDDSKVVKRETSVVVKASKVPSMLTRNKTVERRLNSAQKKKRDEEQGKRAKDEEQQKARKARALELKKKLDKQAQEKKLEKEKLKEEQRLKKVAQEEKIQKQKQAKEQYLKEQKEKISKYKRDQEQTQAEEKQKKEEENRKAGEVRKEAMKEVKKKKDEKAKQSQQNNRKAKQQKEQDEKLKNEEQEKKKEQVRRQAKKKIEEDREKQQQQKNTRETLKKLAQQKSIQDVFAQFKQQIKALYNFGSEHNDIKVGAVSEGLEYKGWLAVTQGFQMCDLNTATLSFKNLAKNHGAKSVTQTVLQDSMVEFACRDMAAQWQGDYEQLVPQAESKLRSFVQGLRIPAQRAKHKEFFLAVKNKNAKKVGGKEEQKKPKEEALEDVNPDDLDQIGKMEVENPNGQKEVWGVKKG